MNVLVGMETSGKIREAFRRMGHDAFSCDLLPSDDNSEYHYQCDIYGVLYQKKWNMIIMHPECTTLCVSGNHVYAHGKSRFNERVKAVRYVDKLWNDCLEITDKVCFENPVGVLPTMSDLPKPYYIQPYQFGHDASKKTGLFTTPELPELKPTKRIQGRFVEYKGKQVERWSNQTDSGQNKLAPSKDRWKLRSETYQGVADAMSKQWGTFL